MRRGTARRGRVFERDFDVRVNRLVIKSLLVPLVQPNHIRGHASKSCFKSKCTTEAVSCLIELNGMVLCTTADVITREVLFEGLSIDRRLRHRKRLDNLGSLP